MTTRYDYYSELVKARRGIEWNNILVAGVGNLVAEVGNSLSCINDEIEAVLQGTPQLHWPSSKNF